MASDAMSTTNGRAVSDRRLTGLNVLLLTMLALHDVDHLRQAASADFTITVRLFVANAFAYVPTLVALYLSVRGHRRAGIVTLCSSLWWIAAFVVVHLVGAGSFYGLWATPYPELGIDWISWTLFVVPIAAAVAGAFVARTRIQRRRPSTTW